MVEFSTRRRRLGCRCGDVGGRLAAQAGRRLGQGLESIGFAIDYEAGAREPDWVFVARRGEMSFVLAMTIASFAPCRWFIGLEDSRSKPLRSETIRREVHPVLQSAIESWPSASEVRWHLDHTTLRELR
jgi:hypothetical protein